MAYQGAQSCSSGNKVVVFNYGCAHKAQGQTPNVTILTQEQVWYG